MSTDADLCPRCRQPLPPEAPGGLCPACLMAGAMETEPLPAGAMPAPEPEMLARGFPNLEILEPLGAGGMGRVYKVRQPHLDRLAALKILPPQFAADPAWVERFHREARALARLNHPHIVQVYDFGESLPVDGRPPLPYLLMEYLDGVNLRQSMQAGGLTAREALAIVPKLCDALQYAHGLGVLHRDLKPENILLDAEGRVKIVDFGLVKFVRQDAMKEPVMLTQTGVQLGTAAYMAPEQIEHPQDVDHRADIYSLGVVFYEMLTGELPLGRFPAPSSHSGVDSRLDAVVFRTLEKKRELRYQSAGEMKTGVQEVSGTPWPSAPQAAAAPSTKASRKGCVITAVVAAVLLLPCLIGITIPLYLRLSHHRQARYPTVAFMMGGAESQVATKISEDLLTRKEGRASLKVEAPQGAIFTVAEMGDVQIPAGGTLWCRAFLKCENNPRGSCLEVHVETTTEPQSGSQKVTILSENGDTFIETKTGAQLHSKGLPQMVRGTQDWQEVHIPVRLNPDVTIARVFVNLVVQGPGTAWVDDIRLSHEATP